MELTWQLNWKDTMLELQIDTSPSWTQTVLNHFDDFLIDHAACEKKASTMAMAMVSHYPDKPKLVNAMIDLAIEELTHFRQVTKLVYEKGLQLASDEKDPYVNGLRQSFRKGRDYYFMDRLLVAGIVEARGHERFSLVAEALPEGSLKNFYQAISTSEERHYQLFLDLALEYFPQNEIEPRLQQLLEHEARIVSSLPLRAALH